ncbi:Decaprenyl-diphosphate synthase subunit 2 [Frankliniella fusca]|uniref:Decaprenyl-diphosphate synthase subunit 2 n=1 Tax=Frankliniella fusca TaxID=407009 RepID=A0AAE1IWJ7_9NEOP|nr:Decaprenyl-diphosphate synthase subunit 2 [Frankliniella fusca]
MLSSKISKYFLRGSVGARTLTVRPVGVSSALLHTDCGRHGAVSQHAHNPKPDWNKAVSEAEKIVGYPTSFLSLRWLLSDEIANVALHLRKLVGSNHPLLKTAKGLLYNGKNNMQAWGLIVLLLSKAAGHHNVNEMEEDKAAGVLYSQRALAEVTEMIRTSHLVHKGLVNIHPGLVQEGAVLSDMTFGNKIALLSGDYLLSNCCVELAALRNQEITELMSSAVRDLTESEFVGQRDQQNHPIPSHPSECSAIAGKVLRRNFETGWTQQGIFKRGIQACLDMEPFMPSAQHSSGVGFSLVSAPVLFHLEYDSSLYSLIQVGAENVNDVDYAKIQSIVSKGPGLAMTKRLRQEHSQKAMEVLAAFEQNDARTALSNIIVAMGEL